MKKLMMSVLVLLIIASACADGRAPNTPDAGSSDASTHTQRFKYTCGRGPVFTAEALEAPGQVEKDDSELGAALRELLKTPEGQTLPRSGWHALTSNDQEVLLGAANPKGHGHPYSSALFEEADEGWEPSGWGACTPTVEVGDRSPTEWKLDKEAEPGNRELRVSLEEKACSSGRKLTENNTRVEVEYSSESIAILVTGDPLDSGDAVFTCQLRVNHIEIPLEEPVGERKLLDVAIYPPARRDR